MGELDPASAHPGVFRLGDAKLILLIGLILGWPAVFPALFLGIVAAGILSFAMIFRGRGTYGLRPASFSSMRRSEARRSSSSAGERSTKRAKPASRGWTSCTRRNISCATCR